MRWTVLLVMLWPSVAAGQAIEYYPLYGDTGNISNYDLHQNDQRTYEAERRIETRESNRAFQPGQPDLNITSPHQSYQPPQVYPPYQIKPLYDYR